MAHEFNFNVYFIISMLIVPVFYYIASHFLYSESITLHYVAGFMLAGINAFHIYIAQHGFIPYTSIAVHTTNDYFAYMPIILTFINSYAFARAYKKYYNKRS